MACATSDISEPCRRFQWMWNSTEDPFSKSQPAKWTSYDDLDNKIIEKAFISDQSHAMLDNYTIDLKNRIQISVNCIEHQRPIKRIEADIDETFVRGERFTFTPLDPKCPFSGIHGWVSVFIKEVAKDLNIKPDELPSKNEKNRQMVVEKAALGIIEEGTKVGKKCQAEYMAQQLEERKTQGMQSVWKCCAKLFTTECFLYKKVNETMRLIGSEEHEQDWRNQVRTLGPFCLLLWDNPSEYKTAKSGKILYRGAELTEKFISSFRDNGAKENKPIGSFQTFTSCTRDLAIAETFAKNVLFIMTVQYAFTVDLKPDSEHPEEEEELLCPGVCFTVDRVEFDSDKKRHMIYLDLIQQHSRPKNKNLYYKRDHPFDPFDLLYGGSGNNTLSRYAARLAGVLLYDYNHRNARDLENIAEFISDVDHGRVGNEDDWEL